MATGFNSAVIARAAAALYDVQLGNASMSWALDQVDRVHGGNVGALIQGVINADPALKALTAAQMAAVIVKNVGVTSGVADAEAYVAAQLTAAGAANYGTAITSLLNGFAALPASNPYGAAAAAFNAQVMGAGAYAQTIGTVDALVHPPAGASQTLVITKLSALGADVMKLTGGQDVRIDFTNSANQITGLDLDGDGTIEFDGQERSITGKAAGYEVVDAYSRNPLNHRDAANNMLGDIYFDGTSNAGAEGDGVGSDGNVFLGGLGADKAFGGVGNDFLAGGGIAQGRTGVRDELRGGRNADFFFAEFSGLDATDGSTLWIDGGNTADDVSAGNQQSAQDADWLLFEASDDDEPVHIWLNDDNVGDQRDGDDGLTDGMGRVLSRSGESLQIDDVENVDASGNLYGFLNGMDTKIGGRAVDSQAAVGTGTDNYGFGASAQLWISGSNVDNIIIGGYDNDYIEGRDGSDLLMGGNLNNLRNPNLINIWNNGRDELVGGAGGDNIVFETDGGIYEAGTVQDADDGEDDTLWLTKNAFGTKTASDVTTDGTVRIDLAVGLSGGLANAAGYGGADKNYVDGSYTSDQTNYKAGFSRAQVQDFNSVIATGLGAVDYLAAGANDPELQFNNQQNHLAFIGNLDLRGNGSDNVLYATAGADVLEGRAGDDALSGGDGNDDFYFFLQGEEGDGVDVIHRQTDDGHNLWTGDYERDFNIGGTSTTGPSKLIVDLGTTNLASADVALTSFTIKIGGTSFAVTNTTALLAANSAAEVAALVNSAYQAIDAKVTAVAVGNTIVVTDTGGRDISDTVAEGYAVGGVVSNGAFSALATYQAPGTQTTKDRLIYKAYEDRLDNEGVDDDSFIGSTITLGSDAYAEDLVIWFGDEDGNGKATTRIAEDQSYALTFTNLTTQDKVTVEVNGVKYSLQVGVDLDGNIIGGEDGVGDTQAAIQAAFLTRLTAFINSFMDDDTSAGAVDASLAGSTITLTQRTYNGEQTVFMTRPVVTLQNLSGGEPAKVSVANTSQHELELLDFDGRNGELNETNVLFVGQEFVNRSELSTALNAGGTQTGYEAVLIDVGADNLQDVVFGTTTAIPNNTATNDNLANEGAVGKGWSVHGDDFMLGGAGIDTISGGTGDDRIEGSIGGNGTTTWDVLDGGKNFYSVQVLGEAQARVYILNKWEAANPSKVTALNSIGTITAITLLNQNEDGFGVMSGVFDDTLQFSQSRFTAGKTNFTITLDNFTLTGGVVELRNDGAGTVMVDLDGDATTTADRSWTKFTNFENIRTVSGVGNAVAGDGQGTDTLDVQALSSATTGANGISYNLTNDNLGGAGGDKGSVMYSANAHASLTRPAATDFESLVIKVDGVENVIGGTGDDLLLIDETEAAKNNTFTGALGDDRVEYQNAFAGEATPGVAEPTVTIKVDNVAASLGGTDTVTMTGGRVGTTVATDTLNGVEFITLAQRTAAGVRENDVLDVTAMTAGAIVNYNDGTVRALDNSLHVTVEGIDEIENIWADGNDTVIVADANIMSGNQREDTANATASTDLALATFIDFDTLNSNNSRKSFISQSAAEIDNVVNQNQFKFNLSKTGSGVDTDTVDYSTANDNIAVVVELDATKPNQFVMVDGDGATFYSGGAGDLENATDRVDQLVSVERIVASLGESVLDLTSSTKGLEIKWSAFDVANQVASLDRDVYSVRISDLTSASPLQRTFVEYRDAGLSGTVTQGQATWNRIEGSDNAEVVVMNSAHAMDADTFNLRGGANQVKYNELTKSITLTLSVSDFVAATPTTTGLITGTVQFQDGTGAGVEGPYIAGSQTHTIRSYTANNGIAAGSLRVAASQDAEDTLKINGLDSKVFLLSEAGTVDNQITVKLGSGTAANSVVLTGFELVSDADSNDVYDFGSLINAASGLNFVDSGVNDHDTVKVGNDAVGFDGTDALGGGAVNAAATEISLQAIRDNGALAATGFDFDVLDITKVTDNTVTTISGATSGLTDWTTDELVFGKIQNITSALDFEAVVLTEATITENGTTFTLNTTTNALVAGAKSVALTDGANTLSFGGTVLEQAAAPNHLRAATDLNATSGVTVNVVGDEDVNITGGNGNDTITTKGGDDVLRGGSGNDTLNGGFTAAVGAKLVVTLTGGASAFTANGDNITIAGATLTAAAAPAAFDPSVISNQILTGSDSDQVGAAFASLSLSTWVTALQGAGATAAEAGALASVTYDGVANTLTFQFNNSAAGSTLVAADVDSADLTGGTITAVEAFTAFTAAIESQDQYVFEATAALNGVDTINNFNNANAATDDTLDFRAFLGGASSLGAAANFVTTGLDLSGAANVGVVWNKASLSASDIATAAAAGKIAVENNGKAVVLVSADADGASDATNDAYKVYYIEDTNTGAGQTWVVTLVATINSNTELNAADLVDGTDGFI